jgi:hypothetical protein
MNVTKLAVEAGPRLGGSYAIAQERAGHQTGANDGGNCDNRGQHGNSFR